MSKYTKIINYLEAKYPKIAEIYETLCLESTLTLKKQPGLTFLVPINSEFIEKLTNLANSDDIKNIDLATKYASAIILNDYYKSLADIINHRDDIDNALTQRLEIEGSQSGQIILKNGAKIWPADNFIDGSKKQKLAVWLLDGEIRIDGPVSPGKYKNVNHVETQTTRSDIRGAIANSLENLYLTEKIGGKSSLAYLDYMNSFIQYLYVNEYCHDILFDKVLPLISGDKTDFYLIIEPYKTMGNYLVSDRVIIDWWENKSMGDINIVAKAFELAKKRYIKPMICPLIYVNQQGALNEINEMRNRIISAKNAPQMFPMIISDIYDTLFGKNIISEALCRYYNDNKMEGINAKMAEDEFRFIIFQQFLDLESKPFDARKFHKIIDMIKSATCLQATKTMLLRKMSATSLPPNEKMAEIKVFINSTMFFHIPLLADTLKSYPHKFDTKKPAPNSSDIYNIAEILIRIKNSILNNQKNNQNTYMLNGNMNRAGIAHDNIVSSSGNIVQQTSSDTIRDELIRMKKEGKLEEYLKNLDFKN